MTISNKMTKLMNAARKRVGAIDKMGSDDLTALLTEDRDILSWPRSKWALNHANGPDDQMKAVATEAMPSASYGDGCGFYLYPGGDYSHGWGVEGYVYLRALVRGNMRLVAFGSDHIDVQLKPDKWTKLTSVYKSNVTLFYGAPKAAGEWFELSDVEFIRLGGVVKNYLFNLVHHLIGGECFGF